jgi:hypothetical protein
MASREREKGTRFPEKHSFNNSSSANLGKFGNVGEGKKEEEEMDAENTPNEK